MASEYGILDITTLNKMINYNLLTTAADNTTRLYDNDFIDELITDQELLVFGDIKATYTSSTVPVAVLSAIRTLSKIAMTNQLIDDKVIKDTGKIDVIQYWNDLLLPTFQSDKDNNAYVNAVLVDDYVFQT